jgi:hypothetical protein
MIDIILAGFVIAGALGIFVTIRSFMRENQRLRDDNIYLARENGMLLNTLLDADRYHRREVDESERWKEG